MLIKSLRDMNPNINSKHYPTDIQRKKYKLFQFIFVKYKFNPQLYTLQKTLEKNERKMQHVPNEHRNKHTDRYMHETQLRRTKDPTMSASTASPASKPVVVVVVNVRWLGNRRGCLRGDVMLFRNSQIP